jgi:inner membrane transporter RhtA
MLVLFPPRGFTLTRDSLALPALLGVVLGGMNFTFYAAIQTLDLGVAVTLEFLGPLAVAIFAAHRPIAVVWALVAGLGVFSITGPGGGPIDAAGVVFVLIAGACWAAYIVVAARLAQREGSAPGLTIAMCVAALFTFPIGLFVAGGDLADGEVLGIGAAVAVLASVIPYSAEVRALRRIRPATFGVLMSLEPAVAAIAGFVILDQGLSIRTALGIVLVVLASAAALRLAAKPTAPPPQEVPLGG